MGFFLKKMKIDKVTPLPCFPEVLKRIMYNRLQQYLCEEHYYTQSCLDSKNNVNLQTMLLPTSLIKSKSPLKMIITHLEYSLICPRYLTPSIIQYC